jgi:phosphoenolpyruvate synthase/pyruvate phosphate dikinase
VYVVPFRALGLEDVALVGGKSAHLGDLTQAGFPVPSGFAVTTGAFEEVVAGRLDELLAGVDPEDVAALEVHAARARALVEGLEVSTQVAEAVRAAYDLLAAEVGVDEPAVAVRSSAVAEDADDASFAGMQSSYLWLRGADDALAGIRRCWASYFNAEALAYRAGRGGAAGMSVAVQCMVDARVAGVLFTLNPVSGDPSSIAIEASYGLGETVVGGEVTPDSYLWSKVTRELLRADIGTKDVERVPDREAGGTALRKVPDELRRRPCLEPDEIERLAALGRGVEEHYGRAQDLEWAIDRATGEVFLLQARPETVWTPKRESAAAGDTVERIAAMYLKGGWIKT